MGALVGWSGLAGVRSLTLTRNDVTRDGLLFLLRRPQGPGGATIHVILNWLDKLAH